MWNPSFLGLWWVRRDAVVSQALTKQMVIIMVYSEKKPEANSCRFLITGGTYTPSWSHSSYNAYQLDSWSKVEINVSITPIIQK